jgi:hypothetical protein
MKPLTGEEDMVLNQVCSDMDLHDVYLDWCVDTKSHCLSSGGFYKFHDALLGLIRKGIFIESEVLKQYPDFRFYMVNGHEN